MPVKTPVTEARPAIRLTKRSVDAADKAEARYTVWDADLKGFGLRVEPSGLKTFIVRYRVGGGRRGKLRQFKIGRYGKLTPDQARTAAEKTLALAELGGDPQGGRLAERNTLTVSELCDLYLAQGVAAKKASTLALDRIRIDRHIKPLVGTRRITAVSVGDVEQMMHDIAAGAKIRSERNPHVRGGRGAASRTVGLLSGIFIFAINRGLAKVNPAKGVRRFEDGRRERFLSPKELGALGDALAASTRDGANPSYIAILRLLALTGARKNEIARLRWSEVELDRARLSLADSKTGQKVVPLGADAVELLRGWSRTPSEFVFPDPVRADEPVRGLDWFWVGLRSRAGLDGLRIHDLRHSFASVAVASGQTLHLIGKLLGHAHSGSTARYAHLADDPIRAAADVISGEVAGAMGIKRTEPPPLVEEWVQDIPSYVDAHLLTDDFEPSEESLRKLRGGVADFERRGVLKPGEAGGVEVVVRSVVDAAQQFRQLRSVLGQGGAETRAAAREQLSELSGALKRIPDELLGLIDLVSGMSTTARKLLGHAYEQAGGAESRGDEARFDPLGWQAGRVSEQATHLAHYFETMRQIVDAAEVAASRRGREKGSADFNFAQAMLRIWLAMRSDSSDVGRHKHLVEWLELGYGVANVTPAISTVVSAKRLIGAMSKGADRADGLFVHGNKIAAAMEV